MSYALFLKLRHLLHPRTAPAGHTHTRGHLRLVHVQPSRTRNDRVHGSLLSNDGRRPQGLKDKRA